MIKVYMVVSRDRACAPVQVVKTIALSLVPEGYVVHTLYLFPGSALSLRKLCVYYFCFFKTLRLALNAEIIHCHGFFPDILGAILFGIPFVRAKIVSTVHCNISRDLRDSRLGIFSYPFSLLWRVSLYCRSGNVFLNYWHRNLFSIRKSSIDRVIPNAVSLDAFDSYSAPFSSRLPNAMLYMGALRPNKGVASLIPVLANLPNLELHVYGGGSPEYKSKLIALAHDLGCQARLIFMGVSSNPLNTMLSYRVALVPSLTEGFCLVVLEAIASGLNVLCNDIPEFKELFGFPPVKIVNYSNPITVARMVSTLIEQPPASQSMSSYLSTYSLDSMSSAYSNFYSEIVASKNLRLLAK